MPTRPLAYTIESRMVAGSWKPCVVAKCTGCGKFTEIQWHGNNNPNFVAKTFHRLGWNFDVYSQSGNKCPTCNKPSDSVVSIKSPDLNKFHERLRWTREQIHLSRDDLAAEAGINRRMLDHLEDGTTNTRYEELHVSAGRKLAAVLVNHGAAIDANWLIGINDATNILSLNLQRICARMSMTEGQLAAKSGVPISIIQSILNGALSATNRAGELAKALSVDLEVLTGGDLPKPQPAPAPISEPQPSPFNGLTAYTGLLSAKDLRKTRTSKDLTQGDLATLIGKQDKVPWAFLTVRTMISQIETGAADGLARPIAATDRLLAMAAMALDLHPVGVPEEVVSLESETVNGSAVALIETPGLPARDDAKGGLPALIDVKELQIDLRRAENDLVGLREMLDDLEPIKLMVQETANKITGIKAVLALRAHDAEGGVLAAQAVKNTRRKPTLTISAPPAPPKQVPEPTFEATINERVRNSLGDHLTLVGGTWFFRRAVPAKARDAFGITEVRRNLGTGNRDEAVKRKMPFERAFEAKLIEAHAK